MLHTDQSWNTYHKSDFKKECVMIPGTSRTFPNRLRPCPHFPLHRLQLLVWMSPFTVIGQQPSEVKMAEIL